MNIVTVILKDKLLALTKEKTKDFQWEICLFNSLRLFSLINNLLRELKLDELKIEDISDELYEVLSGGNHETLEQ